MKYLYIIVFITTVCFSQSEHDARMLGMSDAYTTLVTGYNAVGVNPAALADNKFSINLFSANANIKNNFLSLSRYNDINGSDLEDISSANYYSKSNILELIDGESINLTGKFIVPAPGINIASLNYALSAKLYTYVDLSVPEAFMDLMLNGNEISRAYLLNMRGEAVSYAEYGISYAHKFKNFSLGATLKYLQGLFYFNMYDTEEEGSSITTTPTGLIGSGNYVIEQAFGGSGIGLDIGFLTSQNKNGWRFGTSIINIGGNIIWDSDNLTRNLLGSTLESVLPLRQNEYYFIDFEIDTLDASLLFSGDYEQIFSSSSYAVGIFSDIPTDLFSQITEVCESPNLDGGCDSQNYEDLNGNGVWDPDPYILINQNFSNTLSEDQIIQLSDGSWIVPSDGLSESNLSSSNVKSIKLDHPTYLRVGLSKNIVSEDILLAADLICGLDEMFGNSKKFKLSFGSEINKLKNFPIRLGLSFGGSTGSSSSIGFGYRYKFLSIDFARSYNNSLILHKALGAKYSFGISLNF